MRKLISKIADSILRPIKIRALRASDLCELQTRLRQITSLYNTRCLWSKETNGQLTAVVFSMDRAMQLHAFLTSFREKVKNPPTLHILFHTSSAKHRQSYRELEQLHQRDGKVNFHQQTNEDSFKDDLIRLVADCEADRIAFFVDDIVITEDLDLADLLCYSTDKFVPSLRLGLNISRNYTTSRNQPLPTLIEHAEAGSDKIVWPWQAGILDWGYPLSVDGNLFCRLEILEILKLTDFSAPNSLEDALQDFTAVFQQRLGIAYKKSKIVNIPCNKVQQENNNIAGDIHQDELLKKWQAGLCIDLTKIYGYTNSSPHEEIAISFTKR